MRSSDVAGRDSMQRTTISRSFGADQNELESGRYTAAMTKTTPPPTPARNRLRAAAALIPIVESGINDGKLSEERARQMIKFCEWAATSNALEQDEVVLKSAVADGLARLNMRLDTVQPVEEA